MKKLEPRSTKYRGRTLQYVLLEDIPEPQRQWVQVYMINKLPTIVQDKKKKDHLYKWFWINTTEPKLDGGQKIVKKEAIFYETYAEWYPLAVSEMSTTLRQ